MIPYILLIIAVSICLTLSYKSKLDIYYYVTILLMIVFSGLRSNVGVDYNSYVFMFEDIACDSSISFVDYRFEPLNILIIKIISLFGLGVKTFFFIYALITLVGIGFFIKKTSLLKELSLFIFLTIGIYYLSTLNGIRQWAAVSLILVAIVKTIDKKNIEAILYVVSAILFHYSAVIILIIPFLRFRYPVYQLVLLVILLFYFNNLIDAFVGIRYSIYEIIKFENTSNMFAFYAYVVLILYLLLYFKYFNKKYVIESGVTILLNMNICSIIILMIGGDMKIDFSIIMRVNMYFQISLIILLPLACLRIKNSYLRGGVIFSIILFSASYYFSVLYFRGENYNLIPYQWF